MRWRSGLHQSRLPFLQRCGRRTSTADRSWCSRSLKSCRATARFKHRRISRVLALGPASSGVGTGSWVVTQPGHHHGVERPVQLPVTRAVQAMPGDLPGGRRDRVGRQPGQRTRPRRTGLCCPCSSRRLGRPASTLLTGRVRLVE